MKLKNNDKKELTQDKIEELSGVTNNRKDKIYSGGEDIVKPLKYNPPSDDELLNLAKSTYEDTRKEKIKAAVGTADKKKKSLYESINEQNDKLSSQKEQVDNSYETAKNKLENQSLKRGIQRSSQVIGGFKDLETEKLNAISNLDENSQKYLNSLNKEIRDLESDLGKEISSINEKYANAVQVRLAELKKERDEKLSDVIKYNNTLDLFYPAEHYDDSEASQGGNATSGEVNIADWDDFDLTKVQERHRERINEVINDYLSLEDAKEAFELFKTNDSVKDYLGKYYGYVYKVLSQNADKEV